MLAKMQAAVALNSDEFQSILILIREIQNLFQFRKKKKFVKICGFFPMFST